MTMSLLVARRVLESSQSCVCCSACQECACCRWSGRGESDSDGPSAEGRRCLWRSRTALHCTACLCCPETASRRAERSAAFTSVEYRHLTFVLEQSGRGNIADLLPRRAGPAVSARGLQELGAHSSIGYAGLLDSTPTPGVTSHHISPHPLPLHIVKAVALAFLTTRTLLKTPRTTAACALLPVHTTTALSPLLQASSPSASSPPCHIRHILRTHTPSHNGSSPLLLPRLPSLTPRPACPLRRPRRAAVPPRTCWPAASRAAWRRASCTPQSTSK